MSSDAPKKALAVTLKRGEKLLVGGDLEIIASVKNHSTQIRLIFLTSDGRLPIMREKALLSRAEENKKS